ncbi:MAG: HAD family hydrolase [Candidatus Taylorbacteria bacterium]|nr:HAD family hydrolase [Candidatus Taylorbacteria bacterium]
MTNTELKIATTFKACVLDVDGTLLDTSEFIYLAFECILKKFGFNVPSRDVLIAKTGKRLEVDYAVLTELTDTDELCREHRAFQNKHQDLVRAFPHVRDTLLTLKKRGIKLSAATTRSKITSTASLQNALIYEDAEGKPMFDLILYAENSKAKPDPDSILQSLSKLGVPARKCLMIGDRESDIQAGKNANVVTVGVTYGCSGREIIKSNPDFVIDDIRELLTLV